MSARIHLHWHVWQELTKAQAIVEVNGNTTGECLRHLVEQFPAIEKEIFNEDGSLLEYLSIFVNKELAFPEELTAPVKDRDEIHLIPLIGGG